MTEHCFYSPREKYARLAQRQSIAFTQRGSGVRISHRAKQISHGASGRGRRFNPYIAHAHNHAHRKTPHHIIQYLLRPADKTIGKNHDRGVWRPEPGRDLSAGSAHRQKTQFLPRHCGYVRIPSVIFLARRVRRAPDRPCGTLARSAGGKHRRHTPSLARAASPYRTNCGDYPQRHFVAHRQHPSLRRIIRRSQSPDRVSPRLTKQPRPADAACARRRLQYQDAERSGTFRRRAPARRICGTRDTPLFMADAGRQKTV